jgi:hypothetical protein
MFCPNLVIHVGDVDLLASPSGFGNALDADIAFRKEANDVLRRKMRRCLAVTGAEIVFSAPHAFNICLSN